MSKIGDIADKVGGGKVSPKKGRGKREDEYEEEAEVEEWVQKKDPNSGQV
jgi:hypothetical protein